MTINIKMWRAYIIYHNSKKLQSVQNNKVIIILLIHLLTYYLHASHIYMTLYMFGETLTRVSRTRRIMCFSSAVATWSSCSSVHAHCAKYIPIH